MILATTLLGGFALFEVLAYRYGAESRRGFDERRSDGPYRNI